MNKIKLVALLCLFCVHHAQGQKVDLDPFNFKYEYRDLPHTIIDSGLRTFSVRVNLSAGMEQYITADNIGRKISLEGLSRTDESGDVQITVSIEDIIVSKYQIVENVSETKKKDGTVTKSYSYYINIEYALSGDAQFLDKHELTLIDRTSAFNSRSYSWSSKSFSTNSEAASYYRNNKFSILSGIVRERIDESANKINNYANYNVGFPTESEANYLWLIDNKSHPEYEAMNTRWKALKPLILGINSTTLTEDTRSKIIVMIEYFDGLKVNYIKEEKSDKKVRYAAFYNNAVLYLILDKPEMAVKEAEGLIRNDYDIKDGKELKEKADALLALLIKNDIYSRHFPANSSKPYGIH